MRKFIIGFCFLSLVPVSLSADQNQFLDGFADYKFGMTRAQVAASRKDHMVKKCNDTSYEYCIERSTEIYGYPAKVTAIFRANEPTLKRVVIVQNMEKTGSRSCPDGATAILQTLRSNYGSPQDSEESPLGALTLTWHLMKGGTIVATAMCITNDTGSFITSYEQTEAL